MSKTDKTRPLGCKGAMDAPTGIEADHDHTAGPCDLPPRPTKRLECPFGDRSTSCFWRMSWAFLRSPAGQCGCASCSRGRRAWDRSPAKVQRRAGRRAAAAAMTDVSVHGVNDTLDDVFDWTVLALDPDFDNASSFHSDVARLGTVRDHLIDTGHIPHTAQVVDVNFPDYCDHFFIAYGNCTDPTLPDRSTGRPGWPVCCSVNVGWVIEVLHNDGRREAVHAANDPFTATAAVPVVDGEVQRAASEPSRNG